MRKAKIVAKEFVGGRLSRSYLSAVGEEALERRGKRERTNEVTSRIEDGQSSFTGFLYEAFLPRGYPASVTDDYKSYQIFDSLQAICSSLTGVFAGRAMLKAAGVGNSEATAAAATMNWIIRDGASMIGRVLFTYLYSSNLDSNCKTWRFMADIMNDLALFLEILSPYIPSEAYLLVVCIAGILKTLCGITGGATKAALTQHFALNDNLADVNAKDGTQETAVSLVGILLGFIVSSIVDDNDLRMTIVLFVVFTAAHLQFNYIAVKSVKMRTLNRQRINIQLAHYFATKSILSHNDVQKNERVIWFDTNTVPIHLGSSLNSIIEHIDELHLHTIIDTLRKEHYYTHIEPIGNPAGEVRRVGSVHVFLHTKGNTADTLLHAYFQAFLIRHHKRYFDETNSHVPGKESSFPRGLYEWASKRTREECPAFVAKLRSAHWKTDRLLLDDSDCRIADVD